MTALRGLSAGMILNPQNQADAKVGRYPVDRISLRIGIFMRSEGLDRTSLSMRTLI
jgi:hypothetical protein